jgi:hypothetical protein
MSSVSSEIGRNGFPESMVFQHTWRSYQARVLEHLDLYLDDKRVRIVAAPGSGKTVLGLEITRRIDQPTLVLALPSPSAINGLTAWWDCSCPLAGLGLPGYQPTCGGPRHSLSLPTRFCTVCVLARLTKTWRISTRKRTTTVFRSTPMATQMTISDLLYSSPKVSLKHDSGRLL